MIVPTYAPGDWYAVVTDGSVVMLPPGVPLAAVQEVWASLRGGGTLTDQLQVLLAGGIAAMPPFALVAVGSREVRVVVRGDVEVVLVSAAGRRVVTGDRVATWTEETVEDVWTVAVRAPGAPGGDHLPVLSGTVRAGAVGVELRAVERQARRGATAPAHTNGERSRRQSRQAVTEVPGPPADDLAGERREPDQAATAPPEPERAAPEPAEPEPAAPE
ncbi:hypothetical protein N869_00600, partial [Cellulomonas bogoriensis 69B4 = DSM 16987]